MEIYKSNINEYQSVKVSDHDLIQFMKEALAAGTANFDGYYQPFENIYFVMLRKDITIKDTRNIRRYKDAEYNVYRATKKGIDSLINDNYLLYEITL